MSAPNLEALADRAARKYGIPTALFRGLIKNESGWRVDAVSPVGAKGLTQLTDGKVANPFDPVQNLEGGARYLKQQYDHFGRWDYALAAYNAGPGAVEKYGGVPPYAETQRYVKNLMGYLGGGTAKPAKTAAKAAAVPQVSAPLDLTGYALSVLDDIASGDFSPQHSLSNLTEAVAAAPPPEATLSPQAPAPAKSGASSSKAVSGYTPEFKSALDRMIAASGGRLKVTSGYRSPEEQQKLWTAAVKKYGSESAARKWVAPPGKSNHGRGIAADLSGDLEWAHANASRFGLQFPMSWEPWHIEPVGSRS